MTEAQESRRWLIGICITVCFGLFGVVMALLAYTDRTKRSAPAAAPAIAAPERGAAPSGSGRGKDHGKDRGR